MSPSMAGIAVLVTMLGLLGAGTPIAFALGFVAVAALVLSEGFSAIAAAAVMSSLRMTFACTPSSPT